MDSYIIVMYNHQNYMDKLEAFVMLDGSTKEDAGKYIKKNVMELYDFFFEIVCNVKNMPDDSNLSSVEAAVYKACLKLKGKFSPAGISLKYQKKLAKEIKHQLSELSGEDIIDGFYSCNRKLLSEEANFLANKFGEDSAFYSESKVIPAHKTMEVTHFSKILGKRAIMYQAKIPIENLLPDEV